MKIALTVMTRTATDVPFTEVTTADVVLESGWDAFTPTPPPAVPGQEIQLRVVAAEAVVIAVGRYLDPASRPGPTPILDGDGAVTGEDPVPRPYIRDRYVAFGSKPLDVPFPHGGSVLIGRPGMTLTV